MSGDIWRQYWNDEPTTQNPEQATIAEIGQAYLAEHMAGRGGFAATRTVIRYIIDHLGTARLNELAGKPYILIAFFRNFPVTGWSPKYLYNYRLVLRAAVSYWIKSRALPTPNPVNAVFLDPGTAIRENVPSYQDYRAILEAAKSDAYPRYIGNLITAAWETGLRISEILDWRWENLCLDFRTGLPYYTVWIRKQKVKRARQIPMSQALWQMLVDARGPLRQGPVWPVANPPYRIFRRLFAEAKVPGLWFHDFRKAYKTLRKAEGWTSDITQAIQGHATASMDRYYTVFGRIHLEGYVSKLWNFDEVRQRMAPKKNIAEPLAEPVLLHYTYSHS